MVDLASNSLPTALNLAKIQSSFAQYVLTPINAFGLGGLVFDIEGETSIDLTAEITDHYLEDNSTVQDNIAIRPQRITFSGQIGDVVYSRENSSNAVIQKVAQKLTVLNQYLPELAKQSQQIFSSLTASSQSLSLTNSSRLNTLFSAPTLNNIANIWAAIQNLNPSNGRQQQVYIYLKALMDQKILTSLQTPFEFVTNLAIESITAIQDETTRSASTFVITLKKIRVASTQTTVFNKLQYQDKAAIQSEPTQQLGNNQGTDYNVEYLNQFVVMRPGETN